MSSDWNDRERLCGNCEFWSLSDYQHDWPGCEPLGYYQSNRSRCLRRSPRDTDAGARWPETDKREWCGEFEMRSTTHRRVRRPE